MEYEFKDKGLKRRALTHPSAGDAHYQRLEFLGDRVVGLVVAEMLYGHFPAATEGELGRRHASLVRTETLAAMATAWGLEREIKVEGRMPLTPGVLADAAEALLGAVFLDGGYAAASALVRRHWSPLLAAEDVKDAKTALQEWLQGRRQALPVYELLGSEGPEHLKVFSVRVTGGEACAEGVGNSKKAAELAAAATLLEKLDG
jgi:ribonuclease-3